MKRILISLPISLALMFSLPALADIAPDVLARNTTNEVVSIVKKDPDLRKGNSQKVDALVQEKILPHFDFQQMTKMAVARNWNKATPEQQTQLVNEFRTMLVHTYAASISSVADYQINFKPLKMTPGETDVTVNTEVTRPGSAPITIDYRMEKQNSSWKVYDVLVDSVSLVTNYRSSFNSEVRRAGIDGLIQALARRNKQTAN
ncbi:MAG TPA: ABC transporter substrate-binding protein [Parasulfuritortus sp.]